MDISVYLDQQTSQFMLKTVQQQVHVVNNVKKNNNHVLKWFTHVLLILFFFSLNLNKTFWRGGGLQKRPLASKILQVWDTARVDWQVSQQGGSAREDTSLVIFNLPPQVKNEWLWLAL